MANTFFKKILGDPQKASLKRLQKRVDEVNAHSEDIEKLTDKQLQAKTAEFKKRLEGKETLDDLLPEAFSVVREASMRVLGMRHFDVQVMGGIVLHEGSVAEMRTGEGKTLMAVLAAYLNALTGKGVHVITVNDYLSQRDAGWNGQVFDFMGLSVSVIISDASFVYDPAYTNEEHDDERFAHLRPDSRQAAYNADITYGTNNEFGFDYLRDNMVREVDQLRQRPLHFAIVDEVDSILIDEARTPLIISAPSSSSGSSYATFSSVARQLKPEHYELDEKRRSVVLNDDGTAKVQELLGIDNLYAPENVRMIYHIDQALRAEALFKKDKDYVVSEDGEVIIVDEFTGRLMHGRRYNEGLHQAIEAKEGVEVLQESMTLATISFQNYFRLYEKLSGMTGTAETESEEFFQIYKLDVVVIPTNKPIAREDRQDRIYKNQKAKFNAIVETVKELHEKGQPVLIGTSSIENNELMSFLLSKAGLKHQVLNAKQHEQEAAIVSKAGQIGAITIATNIAGRGTDIVLADGVVDLGGLFVLGSERHESRRIDNQLRGRTGRQGDPGVTQFYVSAEDDLMRIFGGERIRSLMDRMGVDESMPIENKALSRALETAQKKVESHNFDSRKHVVQYDDVMNRHRKATYSLRQNILKSEDVSENVADILAKQVMTFMPGEEEKLKELRNEVKAQFNLEDKEVNQLEKAGKDGFVDELQKIVTKKYESKEKTFKPEVMRRVEREVYLQVLDNLWMQHLESMGHLREGITWRSVGQRDPLVEYRREGQIMFEDMQATLGNEVLRTLFHIQPQPEIEAQAPIETELTKAAKQSVESGTNLQTKSGAKTDKKVKTATRSAKVVDSKDEKRKKREAAKKKKQKRQNKKKKR